MSASAVLTRWNDLDAEAAAREILPCCGSLAWAESLAARRPFAEAEELCALSDAVWAGLAEDDWREAFDSHPRIGQTHARAATTESLAWSSEEQRAAVSPDEAAKLAQAEANRQYEEKFGRIFIVCATGKSAAEILAICQRRMSNTPAAEMLEAAEQQRQITQLRLRRWLGAN
jgi:2-oxo-4-hydroxy-4-carboxy-5-ureidoimidazoline decarboxylase